ncbi:putative ribonuclease H protein [Vitis vinifera]|uniref:Putative ribonuclease H protein n=1 Tax=Vitis vinifera TaxID=29760 RepID=A0A438FTD3_VITVI|nr:putative ribonuclease H protein [Vitis vinifera]
MNRSEAGPSSRRWAVEMDFQKLIGLEGMERADLVTLINPSLKQRLSGEGLPSELQYFQKSEPFRDRALYCLGNRGYQEAANECGVLQSFWGIEEEFRVENTTWLTVDEGSNENDNGCWDLGEANRIGDKARGTEGDSGTSKTQAVRNENEEKWEERDTNSTYVRGCCEKFRLWEILDWRALGYGGGCGRFRNVENGVVWVFTGVYSSSQKWKGMVCGKNLGRLEAFGKTPGGKSSLGMGTTITSHGLDWTDFLCPLAEETLLRLGSKTCGLKLRDSKTLFEAGSEGSRSGGSASFRLAAKMKEIKQKLKEVREGIANAFKQLLSEDTGWKTDIGRLQLDQISQQEAENLEIPFVETEVHSALMEMNGDKAPGPDGFTVAFWLKKVVGKVVSTAQNAFVTGRQILDASLIANEASKEHLTHLSWILLWFEAASGLRINLAKSEIIPVGEVDEIEELAVELGCKVGSLPSQYLGLPLGFLIGLLLCGMGEERVRRRLVLWKRQYISKGRRITHKKHLASMPIYQMSIFRMPKIVARRLEKVQRSGEGKLGGKIHLVKWEVVCTNKNKGGLGLRKLALLNKALLGKWIWRPSLEEDSVLWKRGRNGHFRVKEAYSLLANPNDTVFPSSLFGWIGCQLKSLSLLGRRRGGRCLLWIVGVALGFSQKVTLVFFVFLVYSSNQIHPNVRQSVISSFPHYGHSGIVEAARDLFNQVEGNAGAVVKT